MTDEEVQVQETAPLEEAADQQQMTESEKVVAPKKPEYNFQALREKAERAEREREALARKLAEYEQSNLAKQQQAPKEPEYALNPDDLVEGKHLSKYDREIKALREEVNNYKQQSYQMSAEQQIKSQYPDFEKVVNEQTINDLKAIDPDLAASIGANPDLFSKARAAYNAIKRLGAYKEDNSEADRLRAATNANKPRPLTSVSPQQGDSPLSHANAFANGLTDDLKKQLLKEMQEARKGY